MAHRRFCGDLLQRRFQDSSQLRHTGIEQGGVRGESRRQRSPQGYLTFNDLLDSVIDNFRPEDRLDTERDVQRPGFARLDLVREASWQVEQVSGVKDELVDGPKVLGGIAKRIRAQREFGPSGIQAPALGAVSLEHQHTMCVVVQLKCLRPGWRQVGACLHPSSQRHGERPAKILQRTPPLLQTQQDNAGALTVLLEERLEPARVP
jgi:hypothetical protein